MKIKDLLKKNKPVISFEFFPPKTDEGLASLKETIASLKELEPSFVSMTYGAGGSTRSRTVQLVSEIKNKLGLEAVAHLTCVGHTRQELEDILKELETAGVENVLALRGDPPKGMSGFKAVPNGFSYAAELVGLIHSQFKFCVGVAGYPEKHIESPSLDEDLVRLKEKVMAGADFIVTQLFFNNRDYFSFVRRLETMGVNVPVIAGIMPVTDLEQIKRFSGMCGATLPARLIEKLERAGSDKERVIEIGVEHAIEQCEELLAGGAPGLHFYTLNKSKSTREIYKGLRQWKETR